MGDGDSEESGPNASSSSSWTPSSSYSFGNGSSALGSDTGGALSEASYASSSLNSVGLANRILSGGDGDSHSYTGTHDSLGEGAAASAWGGITGMLPDFLARGSIDRGGSDPHGPQGIAPGKATKRLDRMALVLARMHGDRLDRARGGGGGGGSGGGGGGRSHDKNFAVGRARRQRRRRGRGSGDSGSGDSGGSESGSSAQKGDEGGGGLRVAAEAFARRAQVTGVLGDAENIEHFVETAGAAAEGAETELAAAAMVTAAKGHGAGAMADSALRRAASRARALPPRALRGPNGRALPLGTAVTAGGAGGAGGAGAFAAGAGAGAGLGSGAGAGAGLGIGAAAAALAPGVAAGAAGAALAAEGGGAAGVRAAMGAARNAVAAAGREGSRVAGAAQLSRGAVGATKNLGGIADGFARAARSTGERGLSALLDAASAASDAADLDAKRREMEMSPPDLDTIDNRYNRRAGEVSSLLKARAKAGSGALGILGVRFDIYRDFLQLQSLFFSAMEFPEVFRNFWGLLTTIIAFDIDFLFPTSALLFFWITTISAWLLVAWLFMGALRKADEVRVGVEAREWTEMKKWKRYGTQILLTLLLTLYLPVSRNSVQLFMCRLEPYLKPEPLVEVNAFGVERVTFPGDVCWTYHHILHIVAGAVNIGAVTILVPIKCYRLIREHRPLQNKEHYSSVTGELESSYTDQEYRLALAEDGSPYKFLYDGYEMKWSHYKVIVMIIKVSIILPVVIVGKDDFRTQAIAVLSILSLFAALSFWSAPFIKDEDDRIDQVARTTTWITVLGGLVAFELGGDHDDPIGWGLTGINILCLVAMVILAVWSTRWAKRKWKQITGRVDIDPATGVDLRGERRVRVWQRFWDSLFLFGAKGDGGADGDEAGGDNDEAGGDDGEDGDGATSVEDEYEKIVLRLLEQKGIASEFGPENYKAALRKPTNEQAEARRYAMQHLEGVDVFWDGLVEDSKGGPAVPCTSETCFGKMYVIPFPFRCVVVYDDVPDIAVIGDAELVSFIKANLRPDVAQRRQRRRALRALSGQRVHFLHRAVTKAGALALTNGELRVMQSDIRNPWSHGFRVELIYRTFKGKISIGNAELGITPDMAATRPLMQLLHDNQAAIIARRAVVDAEVLDYRRRLADARNGAILTLAWSFWYVVYNNDVISRESLRSYITGHEANPIVRSIVSKHGLGIDFLFARLAAFDAHPAMAYWFSFWDEFYELNFELSWVEENHSLFNPSYLTCIAYHLCSREVLEQCLDQNGCRGRIPSRHIDFMYARLDEIMVLAEDEADDIQERQ